MIIGPALTNGKLDGTKRILEKKHTSTFMPALHFINEYWVTIHAARRFHWVIFADSRSQALARRNAEPRNGLLLGFESVKSAQTMDDEPV